MMRPTRVWRGARALSRSAVLATAIAGVVVGCSLDGIVGNDELPPDVSDPAVTKTPAGAVAAYGGALTQFRRAFGGGGTGGETGGTFNVSGDVFPAIAGLLSDELGTVTAVTGMEVPSINVDARYLPELTIGSTGDNVGPYSSLQRTRGQVEHAIELLKRYAPDSSALTGHLYALQGFTEVFLAELFCSGIPLSTIDFDGDYTLKPGSSTQQVYEEAVVLFDSALALASDSARFVHLARVGRARALLNLGQFAEAAAAAAPVPDGYQYAVAFSAVTGSQAVNFTRLQNWSGVFTISDREGINGLDYRSSNDPRTQVTARGTDPGSGQTIWHPNKYNINGASPIVLADWIEARLIQAEGALQAGDVTGWLGIMNHLRQTAITPALAALTDPGTPEARVDLLFRERAFWLFLTGHRQGDLRRLVRQYGRDPGTVYPNGLYTGGFPYGGDVTLPVPSSERENNPLYDGCLDRGA